MDYELEKRLAARAKGDAHYCELLRQCAALAGDYIRICSNLSEEDRDRLEQYISVCEEMEYRRTCIAYAMGTQDGLTSGVAQIFVD